MSVNVEALADEVFAAATALARAGARSERRPYGEIITNPNYPLVFFLHAIYELKARDWDAQRLEQVLDQSIPYATSYRALSRDPATRAALGPRLEAAGYQARHDALMAQLFEPVVTADPSVQLESVTSTKTWAAFEGLVRTDWATATDRVVDQVLAFYRWSTENAPQHFFLAYEADRAIAHAGLHQHGFTGYVHALFTLPDSRRQGAGSSLMLHVAEQARAMGCERVVLHCDRGSWLPAHYERLGFRTVGEETVWSKPR